MRSSEMYQDAILDYYRNPRNFGRIKNPDAKAKDNNPLCGDVIEIELKINKNRITDAKFTGEGCAISQASASMLAESVIGKSLDYVKKLGKKDVLKLLGVEIGPVRLKCALLSLKVLKTGVYKYLGENLKEEIL